MGVMTKTFEQVRAVFSKRAVNMTDIQLLHYANNMVREDIKDDYYTTFEQDAAATQEITVVAGQYAYPLPDDFFDVFVPRNMKSPVTDENNLTIQKSYADQYREQNFGFGGRVFWIDSENINFPKESIDKAVIKEGEKIYLNYLKQIPEVEDESEELPFGSRLQDKLFPVYVAGIQYFFFTDGKKIVDRSLQLSNYNTSKANAFSIV